MSSDNRPSPELLAAAVADRDARPWNYYRLEHDDMKRGLNTQADTIASLQATLEAEKLHRVAAEESVTGCAKRVAELSATLKATQDVCRELDAFQRRYERLTHDTLPGNAHYSGLLMEIVQHARAALTASPAAQKCTCWLGEPGATFGSSEAREACAVHGEGASPAAKEQK